MALAGGWIALIVIAVVLLLVIIVVSNSVLIVHQAEGLVIERLGKFHRVATPGINFVWPFIESPRSFTWRKTYIDANRRIKDETITQSRIDLRESVFNFLRQEVFTKDTILVDVNSLMYYSIQDIKKAIYEVDDLQSAISNVAQTQLKDVFGRMTFSEALASQSSINAHMKQHFSAVFFKWGIRVERIELQELSPAANIGKAMAQQMIAERDRRGRFIVAEGNKAAMTITAEGQKFVKFNMGVAQQEATRKRSEGDRDALVALTRAEASALDTIAEAIHADSCSQTEYMISQRYMEMFRDMLTDIDSKTIYLPYEVSSFTGIVDHLPNVYGRNRRGAAATQARSAVAGKSTDAFADLN